MEDFDKNLSNENGKKNDGLPAEREDALSSSEERKAANASAGSPEGGRSSPPSGASNEQLVFHYSREHRLAHASPSVRRIYEEGYNLNKGFIKGLTGNAGLRSTFVMIIILCAAIGLISLFGPSSDEGKFYGADASLSAFSFGENVYVSLSIDKSKEEELPAPLPAMVAAELSVLDSDGAALTDAIVIDWYSGSEKTILRYTFHDYEGVTVAATLYAIGADEEEQIELSAKIIRRE